jgi:hypothetical protein
MSPIVSLNRFERKKNIKLLLHDAYAYMIQQISAQQQSSLPPLIVAGGYNTRNVENVEYRGELRSRSIFGWTFLMPNGRRSF